jgi:hypothetical protein
MLDFLDVLGFDNGSAAGGPAVFTGAASSVTVSATATLTATTVLALVAAPTVVRRFQHAELWSNLQCAGGTRLDAIPDLQECSTFESVELDLRLILTVALNNRVAGSLTEGRVIRLVQSDGAFDEWRIAEVNPKTDGLSVSVTALSPLLDLAVSGLVTQTGGDGTVSYDVEVAGNTVSQYLTSWILPVSPAWVVAGTIHPTGRFDQSFKGLNPLAALRQLAQATGCELGLRRNGTTSYYLDIVTQVGASAPVADLRDEKNLLQLDQQRSMVQQYNVVVPLGADDGSGARTTMSRSQWLIAGVAGTTITLADPANGAPPLAFNNQLNGKYLRNSAGALTQVTASDATLQQVVVVSATGLSVGGLVEFRDNGSGKDLTELTAPADVTTYGRRVLPLDVNDIPAVLNLVPNPVNRTWTGGSTVVPDGWTALGSPGILQETGTAYATLGPYALKVTSGGDGRGVLSPAFSVVLSQEKPWLSYRAVVYLQSGNIRLELVTNTGTVYPLAPALNVPKQKGTITEFGMEGLPLWNTGATTAQLRIVQNGLAGTAVFYVAGVQATNSPTHQPFAEYSTSNRLWQAANDKLLESASPVIAYSGTLLDLNRIDPTVWADAAIELGGTLRVTSPRLGLAGTARVVEVERDYLHPGDTRVSISSRQRDLTGTLTKSSRPTRRVPLVQGEDDVTTPVVSFAEGVIGTDTVVVTGALGDTAQSLTWTVDGAVYTTITPSAGKAFALSFGLADGQLKTLRLTPYGGVNATGAVGTTYALDFIRVPRTSLTVDRRTADGADNPASLRCSFATVPPPVIQTSGAATGATASTLTHSGWTAGAFDYNPSQNKVFYVRVTSGQYAGKCARIASNTTTVLTLADTWTVSGAVAYEIVAGWVRYRQSAGNTQPPSDFSGFLPVPGTGVAYLSASANGVGDLIEFYAERNGTPPEPVQRVLVDADTLPAVTLFEVVSSASTMSINADFDEDAKWWQLYAKKGSYPTLDGQAGGTLDAQYKRLDDTTARSQLNMAASAGTWYLVAVPVASNGDLGTRATTTCVVTASATPALFGQGATPQDDGTTASYNKVYWSHNTGVTGAGAYRVRIYAYRDDLGSGSQVEITGSARDALLDAGANFNNSDDTDSVGSGGSFLHTASSTGWKRGNASTGQLKTWYYTIQLWNWAGTVQYGTYTCSHTDYYIPPVPAFTGGATAGNTNGGGCAGPDNKGHYYADPLYSDLVTWGIQYPNDAQYEMLVEVARDSGSTSYSYAGLAATSVPQFTWYDAYVSGGGTDSGTKYQRYRVSLRRKSDLAIIDTRTSNQLSSVRGTCGGVQ